MNIKKSLRVIGVNVIILGVLVLLIEVIFGAWFNASKGMHFLGVTTNLDVQLETDYYSDEPVTIRHKRDQFGFRGGRTFDRPEQIDILTIGGSTTAQTYLDDTQTWQAHLESMLKAADKDLLISNAGVDGHSTHAHLKSFELWLSEIENLSPRFVLFYIGINDYLPRPFLLKPKTGLFSSLKEVLGDNSVVYNSLRRLKGVYLAKKYVFDAGGKIDFNQYDFVSESTLTSEYRQYYKNQHIPAFKERLKQLINYTVKMGAKPIFVTQPMALYRIKNGELTGANFLHNDHTTGQSLNGLDAYELLTYLNEAIREVCQDKIKVVELTSLPVWETEDFFDWFHNTPKGARKVAEEMNKQLIHYLN